MTGAVSSHAWIVAASYLAAGVVGAIALRVLFTRVQRRAERSRWRGNDILATFLRTVAPWIAGVAGAWGAALALPLTSTWRHDLDHALVAVIVVVASAGTAKVAGETVRARANSHAALRRGRHPDARAHGKVQRLRHFQHQLQRRPADG